MSLFKDFIEKKNIVKNYGFIITILSISLWTLSGIRGVFIFSKWGISYKLLEFGLLDTFVFLLFNCTFVILIFVLPYYLNELENESVPLMLKVNFTWCYLAISFANAIYTQGVNKEYINFINKYPTIAILMITTICLLHFATYKETLSVLSKKRTKDNIISEKGVASIICIRILQIIQFYYSKFLVGKMDYNLIVKFSNYLENKVIFRFRQLKEIIYFLSSATIGLLLMFTIFMSLTNLNYPNGSQYDYVEIDNVKYLIIGEYQGSFIVANYYRVNDLQKDLIKQYNEYDYIINTVEYRLIKVESQKLGKVNVPNAYIEKTVKVK